MKKLLLFSLLSTLSVAKLFAGENPVSVKSGDISVLKTQSQALLEIDYSAAIVGEMTLEEYLQKRGDDWVRDWPKDKERGAYEFVKRFNKKSKGMKLITDATDVTHKFVIRVADIDLGFGGGAALSAFTFAPAKTGGVTMIGTIEIIDLKTNEIVCVLDVDKVKGLANQRLAYRLGLMYYELAGCIFKIK